MRTIAHAQNAKADSWFDAIVPAPFGAVGVRLNSTQDKVFELSYLPPEFEGKQGDSTLAQRAFQQISEYLINCQATFDLPLMAQGTAFQNRVWRAVDAIESGQVLSYKQVGQIIQCGSPRAVGGACGANPYPLITPCHRVVAADGLGGFARHDNGFHIGVKRWLLAHEGIAY